MLPARKSAPQQIIEDRGTQDDKDEDPELQAGHSERVRWALWVLHQPLCVHMNEGEDRRYLQDLRQEVGWDTAPEETWHELIEPVEESQKEEQPAEDEPEEDDDSSEDETEQEAFFDKLPAPARMQLHHDGTIDKLPAPARMQLREKPEEIYATEPVPQLKGNRERRASPVGNTYAPPPKWTKERRASPVGNVYAKAYGTYGAPWRRGPPEFEDPRGQLRSSSRRGPSSGPLEKCTRSSLCTRVPEHGGLCNGPDQGGPTPHRASERPLRTKPTARSSPPVRSKPLHVAGRKSPSSMSKSPPVGGSKPHAAASARSPPSAPRGRSPPLSSRTLPSPGPGPGPPSSSVAIPEHDGGQEVTY